MNLNIITNTRILGNIGQIVRIEFEIINQGYLTLNLANINRINLYIFTAIICNAVASIAIHDIDLPLTGANQFACDKDFTTLRLKTRDSHNIFISIIFRIKQACYLT